MDEKALGMFEFTMQYKVKKLKNGQIYVELFMYINGQYRRIKKYIVIDYTLVIMFLKMLNFFIQELGGIGK